MVWETPVAVMDVWVVELWVWLVMVMSVAVVYVAAAAGGASAALTSVSVIPSGTVSVRAWGLGTCA